jgi:BTB And C-terminal Kelch/Kelch motif
MRYLQAHLVPLMQSLSAAPSLQLLPLSLLEKLLGSDELEISSEYDVAQAAAIWALGHVEERMQHIPSLLRTVRATLNTEANAAAVESAAAIIHGSNSSSSLDQCYSSPCSPDDVAKVSQAFTNAVCQQINNSTSTTNYSINGLPRQGSPTQLMAVGGVDEGWRSLKTVELYDPRKDEWKIGPGMPSPCSFAAACTLGTKAFAIEGSAHLSVAQVYDRKKQKWELISNPCTARVNMAAAAIPNSGVFVLGGRVGTGRAGISQRTVDRYNPVTGNWDDDIALMKAPRTSLAACTVNGQNIIAVGGQSDRATHNSAELFDPGRNEWFTLDAKLEYPRKYLGVAAVGGQVIATGGMTAARQRLASVEALDFREGRWRSLPCLSVPRSSCGVGVLHGEVFVAGGSVGEGAAYDGVECLSLTAGKWRCCAGLASGRSGLAMTPV